MGLGFRVYSCKWGWVLGYTLVNGVGYTFVNGVGYTLVCGASGTVGEGLWCTTRRYTGLQLETTFGTGHLCHTCPNYNGREKFDLFIQTMYRKNEQRRIVVGNGQMGMVTKPL